VLSLVCNNSVGIQNVTTHSIHNYHSTLKGDGHVSTQISFSFAGNVNKKPPLNVTSLLQFHAGGLVLANEEVVLQGD
jgi:hypothetical protein